ncbi:MAG: hypothetical protein GY842_05950 [bacterium]|nr:hypothetical protein [bacterium]
MRWAGLGLAGMMIVALTSCSPKGPQSVQSAGTPPDSPVLIVTVQSRDHSVKIYSGDRYTVENAEGQLVVELVTEDEFKQLLPETFAHVKEALADNA